MKFLAACKAGFVILVLPDLGHMVHDMGMVTCFLTRYKLQDLVCPERMLFFAAVRRTVSSRFRGRVL